MLRGKIKTQCPKCGTRFEAPDIELNATAQSAPVKCPLCSHVFCPTA